MMINLMDKTLGLTYSHAQIIWILNLAWLTLYFWTRTEINPDGNDYDERVQLYTDNDLAVRKNSEGVLGK